MENLSLKFFHKDAEDIKSEKLAQIEAAIASYPKSWGLLHEPLQNAIDSFVDPADLSVVVPGGGAVVSLTFDLDSSTVTVEDNGRGIPRDNICHIFNPNSTSKRGHGTGRKFRRTIKGFAGIGIKSTVYRSTKFELITWDGASRHQAQLIDARQFANWPVGKEIKIVSTPDTHDTGTRICVSFGEDYTVAHLLESMVDEWLSNLHLRPTDSKTADSFKYGGKARKIRLSNRLRILLSGSCALPVMLAASREPSAT